MALTNLLTFASLVSPFAPTLAPPPPSASFTTQVKTDSVAVESAWPTHALTGINTPAEPPWSVLSMTGPPITDSFSSILSVDLTTTIESDTSLVTATATTALLVSSASSTWTPGASVSSESIKSVTATAPTSLPVSSSSSAWTPGASVSSEPTKSVTAVTSFTVSSTATTKTTPTTMETALTTTKPAPTTTKTTPATGSSTISPPPSPTKSAAAAHKAKARMIKLLSIIIPTAFIFVVILAALGYWLRSRRRERKRADELARKADWFDQAYIDNIKRQFASLDPTKTGVLGPDSPINGPVDGEGVLTVRKRRTANTTPITTPRRSLVRTASQAMKRYGVFINPLAMNPAGPSQEDLNAASYELSSSIGGGSSSSSLASSVAYSGNNSPTGTVIVSRAPAPFFLSANPLEDVFVSDSPTSRALPAWVYGTEEEALPRLPSPVTTYYSTSSDTAEANQERGI
ncbi:hypothetical protein A1O1_01985 [Capronia coronata CBS 617.96]|uniref:Mid2 domain-containing protein n=1 Tax=Capronia coronata CBS 617.96 TaxID=1182541 RepID=W9YM06_9EURO|nr:uncharacterized protein A1O1_01985 [Capronia coronata CBS 617.96]EXJ93593.1 hypothetical protein A1O1_01985 [Capronia coronata CBS 617.96]